MRNSGVAGAVFVTRFCGTTPLASSSRALISSMAQQIRRAYSADPVTPLTDVPTEYPALIGKYQNLRDLLEILFCYPNPVKNSNSCFLPPFPTFRTS